MTSVVITANSSLSQESDLKNQFINCLLKGHLSDETLVLQRAKQLGIDLIPPRAVILIDASQFIFAQNDLSMATQSLPKSRLPASPSTLRESRSQFIIRSLVRFFQLPNDAICADLGQGTIAVLKASDTKNLDRWVRAEDAAESTGSWANLTALKRAANALLTRLQSETDTVINIGIGRYHPGIRGLFRSYEDARVALSLGIRLRGDNQVHCLSEMGIVAFVGVPDETTKIDLARYLLSPLDHEPELLATLNTFFTENCCPSATAKRLSIHRNTLSYRLDKIHSLTGLEPRHFDDAVQMRLSLVLRSLQSSDKKNGEA